jgi:hypothetical protein
MGRNMITEEQAAAYLKQQGIAMADADIQNRLSAIDQNAVLQEQMNRIEIKVWDKKSDLNGVSASYFLNRFDVPKDADAEIYLIYVDGQLQMFQPHNPGLPGCVKLSAADVDMTNPDSVASIHKSDYAGMLADNKVMQTIAGNS